MQIFTNWNSFLGYRGVRLIVEACVCMDQRGTPLGASLGGVRLSGGKSKRRGASVHARASLLRIFVSSE